SDVYKRQGEWTVERTCTEHGVFVFEVGGSETVNDSDIDWVARSLDDDFSLNGVWRRCPKEAFVGLRPWGREILSRFSLECWCELCS
ncbi:MAG: hypothetical protein N3G20_07370, partial [Verrucomicrobiae bacterium]|nr:hypothetical protein [Verrucomicrobiae bacterium]